MPLVGQGPSVRFGLIRVPEEAVCCEVNAKMRGHDTIRVTVGRGF